MSIDDDYLARCEDFPRPGTPGPWSLHGCGCILSDDDTIVFGQPDDPNGEVLAAAPEIREAIDVLVAEVRRLRARVKQLGRQARIEYQHGYRLGHQEGIRDPGPLGFPPGAPGEEGA